MRPDETRSSYYPTPKGIPLEFRDYLHVLRRARILIVVLALGGGALGFGAGALQSATYAATATTFVSAKSASSLSDLSSGTSYIEAAVAGYATIAKTAYVLQPVIKELHLGTTPGALAGRISADSTGGAVLAITVTGKRAAQTAEIANAVAEQLKSAVITLTPGSQSKSADSQVKLTVVDPAITPTKSVNPPATLLAAGGALAGAVIAVLLGLLREITDTRVRTQEDVTRITSLPILGGTSDDPTAPRRPLAVLNGSRTPRAESFRSLRTNLRFVDLGERTRSVVVTSSIDGEGKSTTAANLALAVADLGQKVLLVDADLRRPRMDRIFGMDGGVGLSDVLIGAVPLEDAVQSFLKTDLEVLPAGTIPPNPNEQLQSRAMQELVERLHGAYDLVVFDTPPLLAVSDAAVLSELAGGVIVVSASGRVRRAQLDGALAALDRVGARVAGIVMTMLPRRGSDGYGYSYGITESKQATSSPLPVRLKPAKRGTRSAW